MKESVPFKVLSEDINYVFISLDFDDAKQIAKTCFNYFFSERNLYLYFEGIVPENIIEPNDEIYASLYRRLHKFLDDDINEIRKDKVGKIGEYFLSILLFSYFDYECLIPKLISITNSNMAVFGCDALFYSKKLDYLLFGEAKLTDNISLGIREIEGSLDTYQSKLYNDFNYIFENKHQILSRHPELSELFGITSAAINFKKFMEKAGFKEIGIPLFICHGKEKDETEIIKKLKSIKKKDKILDYQVKYICISLPILNKEEFLKELKDIMKQTAKDYERRID